VKNLGPHGLDALEGGLGIILHVRFEREKVLTNTSPIFSGDSSGGGPPGYG